MHLGQEPSRNWTKATMRICWLLFSLSFLFHSSATSLDDTSAAPTMTAATGPAAIGPAAPTTIAATDPAATGPAAPTKTAATGPAATGPAAPTKTAATGPTALPATPAATVAGGPTALTATPAATVAGSPTALTATPATTVAGGPATLTAAPGSSGAPATGPNPAVLTVTSALAVTADQTGKTSALPLGTIKFHSDITTVSARATERQPSPAHTKQTSSDNNIITTSFVVTTTSSSYVTKNLTTTKTGQPKILEYVQKSKNEVEKEKDKDGESVQQTKMREVCKQLLANMEDEDGSCHLKWIENTGKVEFKSAEINGKVKTSLVDQIYGAIAKNQGDNKTLIAILASCGALLIMIIILAVCASHHRKPYNENQQHLTEELHTVENGYHDNPTLEVMEVQPEMQEKKMALNGEFNDSWIVPFDNLLKEDVPDEEDTHL